MARMHPRISGAVLFVGVAFFGGGCELLVGDTPPTVTCEADDGCPAGMVCNLATHSCVYPGDAIGPPDVTTNDVTSEQPASEAGDVATDPTSEPTSCRSLGCTCAGDLDCDSQICADQLTVTAGLYNEVGHGFCIQPCCTSSDCPSGFVCFGTGAGGNYCIDPSLVGRSAPGSMMGGSTCSSDGECRSGLCAGTCQDTCCSMYASGECANSCRYGAFPGRDIDTHFTAHCTSSGGMTQNGNSCGNDGECLSDLCYLYTFEFCAGACQSSADCGLGGYCDWALDSSDDLFAACFAGTGPTGLGGSCTKDANCATALCDPTSKQCTDVCYSNSACSSVSGWRCRPETLTIMGALSASVLLCGM